MSTIEAVEVREAAVAAEQSARQPHVSALYIGTSASSPILSAWASVSVHRGSAYSRWYSAVSASSFARAQRAQVVLLARGVSA